jgi:hypothetical protein
MRHLSQDSYHLAGVADLLLKLGVRRDVGEVVVDFFLAGTPLEIERQNGQRHIRDGHANGAAAQLAGE